MDGSLFSKEVLMGNSLSKPENTRGSQLESPASEELLARDPPNPGICIIGGTHGHPRRKGKVEGT